MLHLRAGDKPLLLRDMQKISGNDTSAIVLKLKAGLLAGAKREARKAEVAMTQHRR